MNAIGVVVDVRLLAEISNKLNINTTVYPNGIYLARIETGSKALLKNKFIILK
ncbi:MAG: T9SS type A sorting domain-containing protein [Chitinophagales bacterium]|nr:T9SS type A sorting domain-containing protein [Chitinophagales bacterium]